MEQLEELVSCSGGEIYCILYTVYCILYTVYCILYTVYCILYTPVYCIPCTHLYCIHLYTVYTCMLYTVYTCIHTCSGGEGLWEDLPDEAVEGTGVLPQINSPLEDTRLAIRIGLQTLQGARCKVQGAWCMVQGAREGAWCIVQGARCKVHGYLSEVCTVKNCLSIRQVVLAELEI